MFSLSFEYRFTSQWVTEYAKTSVFEDFAESYMTFVLAPARLRAVSEAKYNIIAALFDGMAEAAGQMAHARGGWIG